MSYGFQVENPSGGLVLSADGFGMNYIGKASFVQNEDAPELNGLYAGGTYTQFKRYRINSSSPLVFPFLELSSANVCGVAKVEQGAGYWDFVIFNQNSSNVCQAINIYCFGRPTTRSSWGMNLFNADGTLAWDIGSQRLLMFQGVVDFGLNQTSATIPSLTKPAVLGFGSGFIDPLWVPWRLQYGQWYANAAVRGFRLYNSTTLVLNDKISRLGDWYEFEVGTSPGSDYYTYPFTAYLIDATGLS